MELDVSAGATSKNPFLLDLNIVEPTPVCRRHVAMSQCHHQKAQGTIDNTHSQPTKSLAATKCKMERKCEQRESGDGSCRTLTATVLGIPTCGIQHPPFNEHGRWTSPPSKEKLHKAWEERILLTTLTARVMYPDGSTYEGEVRNGLRAGQGRQFFSQGRGFYPGSFAENKFEGFGWCVWADGEEYEGEWKDDKPHGKGKYRWSNNDIYEGEYMCGLRHGQGFYRFCGGHYKGSFVRGKREGLGILLLANGQKYHGSWKDDKPHGSGWWKGQGPETYAGEFRNGFRDGHGRYTFADGGYYEGSFVKDIFEGDGRRVWADKEEYDGEWQNNRPHGKGIYKWPSGSRYEGQYSLGLKEGFGRYDFVGGGYYEGSFAGDVFHGFGKRVWVDGEEYVGDWKDDSRHGRGETRWSNGDFFAGEYRNGSSVQSRSLSQGRKFLGVDLASTHGSEFGTTSAVKGIMYKEEFAKGGEGLWRNFVRRLAQSGQISNLLYVMQQNEEAIGLQGEGFVALCKLCSTNAENKTKIAEAGGVAVIVRSMQNHLPVVQVQQYGCRVLASLALNDVGIKETIPEADGVSAILDAMHHHEMVAEVQLYGCWALRNLASSNVANQKLIGEAGGISIIVGAMKLHEMVASVQTQGCAAVRNLTALRSENNKAIVANGGISAVVNAMTRHAMIASVQEQGCGALQGLALNDKRTQKMIADVGGISLIVDAMQRHLLVANVQLQGCRALSKITWKNSENQRKIDEFGGIGMIVRTMQVHELAADVQEQAFRALHNFAAGHVGNQDKVRTTGGIAIILRGMQRHECFANIHKEGLRALAILGANNVENSKMIKEAGGIALILRVMHLHKFVPDVQKQGCRALHHLTENDEHKKKIGQAPRISVIQGIHIGVVAQADIDRDMSQGQGPIVLTPRAIAEAPITNAAARDNTSGAAQSTAASLPLECRVSESSSSDEAFQDQRWGDSRSFVSWTRNRGSKKRFHCLTPRVVLIVSEFAVFVAVLVLSMPQMARMLRSRPAPPISPAESAPALSPIVQVSNTLNSIVSHGTLRCGIPQPQQGFSAFTGLEYEGFEVDLCRALAAAIFGQDFDSKLQLREASPFTRFHMLQNDEVDVLAAHTTLTMQRDVYEPTAMAGFSFSQPYLYDFLGLAGQSHFVDCAAIRDSSSTSCLSLRICVLDATTHLSQLTILFPVRVLAVLPTMTSYYEAFKDGTCNVLAGGQFEISEQLVRTNGYVGNYTIATVVLSKEPLALTTRDDDPAWSDFVNSVLQSLMFAEEKQITQRSAFALRTTDAFGSQFSGMFVNVVSTVGNYGEMYQRHLEPLLPRQPVNRINEGDSPLMYAHPFGHVSTLGMTPPKDCTLELIRQRGWLRCGVRRLLGFAEFDTLTQEWSGLDVDFCRAISAAIFNGRTSNVSLIEVSTTERFEALDIHAVDVLFRTTATLERDIGNPPVRSGFTFSQATLYDGLAFGGMPPFDSCAENLQALGECASLRVCVGQDTTIMRRVSELFDGRVIVPLRNTTAALQGLARGQCNVVASDSTSLSRQNIRTVGQWEGPYEVGRKRFSREPLTPMVRQDDPHFAAMVTWIVSATFHAEERGITQRTASLMPLVSLFGNSVYRGMLRQAIAAVGNFGEIYERNLGEISPRSGANQLNVYPFGPQISVMPGF